MSTVGDDRWAAPGLGGCDVRGLVGHTSRAFSTLVTALDRPAGEVDLSSPEDYFRAVLSQPGVDDVVRERGVASGKALGERPAEAFAALCDSALTKVSTPSPADADATIMMVAGGMRAGDYVRTRTFELVVHGIDVAKTLGAEPLVPEAALRESLAIAAGLAMQSGKGSSVLAGLTGRGGLTEDFAVLG